MLNCAPYLFGSAICLLVLSTHSYGEQTDEKGLLLSYGDESFVSIATGRKQLISKRLPL